MVYTDEELIQMVRECKEKYNKVTRSLLTNDDKFCNGKTIYNHFGSIEKACEIAGVSQKIGKITVYCESCSSELQRWPYQIEQYSGDGPENCKHCMTKRKEVKCHICGDNIIRHKYLIDKSKFSVCSQQCMGKWRSENTRKENHPRWNGGYENDYGYNWKEQRRKQLKETPYCETCGISRTKHKENKNMDLDVHHIVPRYLFTQWDLPVEDSNVTTNLMTLCRVCHMRKEYE